MKYSLRIALTLIYIFLYHHSYSQKPDLRFRHINSIQGLSHNFVRNILQDYEGFMWFATADGINRYDGYNIKAYKNEIGNNKSLNHNDVWLVFEDKDKRLLVGTRFGLNIYNRDQDNFTVDSVIGSRNVSCITEDNERNVWICTWGELFYFDSLTKKFKKFECEGLDSDISQILIDSKGNFWLISNVRGLFLMDKKQKKLVQQNLGVKEVRAIYEDHQHNLWVSTREKGLMLYNGATQQSQIFPTLSNALHGKDIISINDGPDGNLWLGTENGGLYIFDVKKEKFYNYINIEYELESLGSNSIYKVYKDKDNNMWLGTYGSGVEFVEERSFTHIKKQVLSQNTLSSNNISFLREDSEGNLWIGTDGAGLNMLDRKNGTFIHYKTDPNNKNSISNDVVTEIYEDKDGYLWLGYWAGGIDRFDRKKKRFLHFRRDDDKPGSLLDNNIVKLYEDRKGMLWIGTSNGLDLMDRQKQKFIHYNTIAPLKSFIGDIYEDSYNNFWVGTFDGLNILNRATKEVTTFLHKEKDSTSLSNNMVYNIFEDSNHNIWIGTAGGLNLFNRKDKTFKNYTKKDGLPSDPIYAILEDNSGNLWLSTANGLCKFNPKKNSFKTYTVSDGLQGNFFKENTFLKTREGELLFGGNNGFNILNTDKIESNKFIPPVYITDFRIFNQPTTPETKDSPLKKQIVETHHLILSYKQSVFSFDFAALNYKSPEKNQYAYMLEGLETEWNYVGNKRSATYTNLDPGEYTFKVKASNNDGLWNEKGVSLKILVTPPYWKTWWFKFLIFFILISGAFSLHIFRLKTLKHQKVLLEEKVKIRTQEISRQKEEIAEQAEELKSLVTELDLQKGHVESLFTELTDSIRAAKLIQNSILPSIDYIKSFLPQCFIYNQPKDVVGGDFYWFDEVNGKIIFAVVDCTGHGVSGAFMSITGHHLLNKSIYSQEELKASRILDRLNQEIILELNQYNEEIILDGMDISLCIIDLANKKLEFAGASIPMYLVRDGVLTEIKANKFSIGLSITNQVRSFSNNEIDLEENDSIYLFSDGYADQLGGENHNEKFFYSRFRELILKISENDMEEQLTLVDQNLINWRKDTPQLDDILIVGFKI